MFKSFCFEFALSDRTVLTPVEFAISGYILTFPGTKFVLDCSYKIYVKNYESSLSEKLTLDGGQHGQEQNKMLAKMVRWRRRIARRA